MRFLKATSLAVFGLALPLGLALAVYISSAGTITVAPASLPPATETIAQPSAAPKAQGKKQHEQKEVWTETKSASTGTTTMDDHGGRTSSGSGGSNSGPGSGDDSSSSGSGSDSSGSGSSGSGSDD